MSTTFGMRMREVRGERTLEDFSKLIEIGRTTLMNYENGSRLPDIGVVITTLERCPEVSAQWLLFGDAKTDSAPSVDLPPEERELLMLYRATDKAGRHAITGVAAAVKKTKPKTGTIKKETP